MSDNDTSDPDDAPAIANISDARKRRESQAPPPVVKLSVLHVKYDVRTSVCRTRANAEGDFEIVYQPAADVPRGFCMSRNDALRLAAELIVTALGEDNDDAHRAG